MIQAIVFDMDGVLIDAKDWHYDALNQALGLFGFTISRNEHLNIFDGLPTSKKLEILSETTTLPTELHAFVNDLKQTYTVEMIYERCRPLFIHEYALSRLQADGYRLGVASNSVRNTVETMMQRARLTPYLDVMLSNEDVEVAKPSPEIYLRAMESLKVEPDATLVIEDNENGIRSAEAAGAHVMVVKDVLDVNLDNIRAAIAKAEGASR